MTAVMIVLGATLWDLLFGEPSPSYHPVVFMGRFIAAFWSRRPRGRVPLFLHGTALVLSGAALFSLPALLVSLLPAPVAFVLSVPLLKTTFSLTGLLKAGEGVLGALERGDVPEARRRLARDLVSRKTDELDGDEIAGATVESLAENLTDSFVSPLFFFACFGLPGALVYRFCNTCDSMIGYRGGDTEWGGKFAARFDDVLNWIPARVSAAFLLGAGALCGGDVPGGARALRRQRTRTDSPNAGWTMSVMAGLLGVTLSKRGCYELVGGTKSPGPDDIRRCLAIVRAAAGLFLALAWIGGMIRVPFR